MTRIDPWAEFAEATLTRQDTARQMGRNLAASTPPIALAAKARHRKRHMRRNWIRLPMWLAALFQLFDALHEQTAATEGQLAALAEIARGGTL